MHKKCIRNAKDMYRKFIKNAKEIHKKYLRKRIGFVWRPGVLETHLPVIHWLEVYWNWGLVDLSYLSLTYLWFSGLRVLDTCVGLMDLWDSVTCGSLTWEFLILFGTYGFELLEIQLPVTHWPEPSWYK